DRDALRSRAGRGAAAEPSARRSRAGGRRYGHRMPDGASVPRLAFAGMVEDRRHRRSAAARPVSCRTGVRFRERRTDSGGHAVTLPPPRAHLSPPPAPPLRTHGAASTRVNASAGKRACAYLIDVTIVAVVALLVWFFTG